MAPKKKSSEDKILEDTSFFRSNAGAMIEKMLELNNSRQDKQLVNEILHSIFFLGRIMTLPSSPEEILLNKGYLAELKKQYPRPFDLCSSQLPRRSPFSCLLDMIVLLKGQKNEDEIIERLQEIISPLSKNHLVSAAICVSQITNKNSACRYYGVSMSRMPSESRRIMISASCLGYWDSYVAGAVMTYHPNDTKHPDFDGTITLPKYVRCETFKLFTGGKVTMPPCKSCQNLFGLKPKLFPYGNCAEAESVSNLFKKDSKVREQARPNPEKFTDDNRETAVEIARTYLMEKLPQGFTRDIQFYNPQL